MGRFGGRVTDAFVMQGKGVVLQMSDVQGLPADGMSLSGFETQCDIIAINEPASGGGPVSNRSCLTGRPVSPHCMVLVSLAVPEIDMAKLVGRWIETESDDV